MKFTCEKAILMRAVTDVSRAVAARSSLPALEGILIQAGKTLSLTAYNLEIGIHTTVGANILKEGGAVVGARLLADIVRRLPDAPVTLELSDRFVLHITCGVTDFDIASCLPADTFPELPEVSPEAGTVLPQHLLRSMIAGTVFSCAVSETKQVHTGSLFAFEDGLLTMVSVDGFRMAIRREAVTGEGIARVFVTPGAALREVERILSDAEEETVSIVLGARHIGFVMGETTLVTRLLDGEFLSYKTAVPTDRPTRVVFQTAQLRESVERVSLLVSEKIKNPVRVTVTPEGLSLQCLTTLGRGVDFCPAEVTGAGFEIGFNHRYLLDALRAIPDETVALEMKGPLSPAVILPMEGNKYLYMVLPVRLKAENN